MSGNELSRVPVPHGDPGAISRAAATYTAAHGEIERNRAQLTSSAAKADGIAWTGTGAAACISVAGKLAAVYARTAAALAQGATALRAYSVALAAAQQAARQANNAVETANATAQALAAAQLAARRAQDSAIQAGLASAAADIEAAFSPHSVPAQLKADNARSASREADTAAAHAAATVSALQARYDVERSTALTLCDEATARASLATSHAVAALDAAASELTGTATRPARGGAAGTHGSGGHSSFLSSLLHGAEHLGEDAVNGLASAGNAMIHDPGGVFAMLAGLGLAGISSGGEAIGAGLTATGVGAIAGVPLDVLSAAGITTGVTVAGAGATSIVRDALGPDRVTVLQSSSNRDLPQTGHGAERAADPSRLDPEAQAEVVANPTQTYTQDDGAQVFVKQVGDRYDVVVKGNRGVITNLKNISQSSLNRLIRNYGWTPN